ncbi:MAG: ATP-binding protein [Clostridia bacterium]|nr:ATP-binding protein [Clostridia bacterium]
MTIKNKTLLFIIVLATTIMGQVYIKPFNTDFRISIGIVILTVLLLRFQEIPVMLTCGLTGISIFIFRFTLDYLSQIYAANELIGKHFPSALFYLFFGMILVTLKFREVVSKPVLALVILAIADVSANTMELIIRGDLGSIHPEVASISIVATGVIRALTSYVLYLSEKFYSLLIISKEQRAKYKEFVMMRANIKSEIFFMQKSMEDIEIAMKESFAVYRALNEKQDGLDQQEVQQMKNKLLGISKGIHEIKKDYIRIIAGMGNVIPDIGFTKYKNAEEIFSILQEVTEKYIRKTGKSITFSIEINRDFPIFYYSPLLSVLNNLIVNAIDAIDHMGWVRLKVVENLETVEFTVTDNGKGIKPKHLEAIFNPGFSTKFDKRTGKMSTGIGLTHVKHIVEKSLLGNISVLSQPDQFTKFHVVVSRRVLCVGGQDE